MHGTFAGTMESWFLSTAPDTSKGIPIGESNMPDQEQKKEIIREILLKYSGSVSGFEKLKQELWSSSLEQLQRILDAYRVDVTEAQQRIADIQADRQRMYQEQALSNIFRTPVNGRVAIDNQANRSIIAGWAHEDQGEQITPAWFTKVLREQPQLARQISWHSADVLDPPKRRQQEANQESEDRETFNAFARENGFSEVEANVQLAKSVLGSGFNSHQLSEAVSSNALNLTQASPVELEQFRQEAAEQRQDYLVNHASPQELRQAARQESAQRRTQAQQQHAAQQVQIREQAEASIGYAVLPETDRDGNKIDRAYLLKLADVDIRKYKQLCNFHGMANVTARLNGVR
jgi:hypothetical protein